MNGQPNGSMDGAPETDLYEVLNVTKGASKSEIKKAYHKAALTSHPDKVADDQRAEAEIKFKSVSQAYEILSDDDKRNLYDTHGMAAFEKGQNGFPGGGPDMEDILAQMFGMGSGGGGGGPFEGMHGAFPGAGAGGGPGRRRPKGKPEVQQYEVSLEELYKGKTTRFASTKNVICSTCDGRGGKEKAKAKECETCKGTGRSTRLRQLGGNLVTQETVPCSTCGGRGKFYAEKDKCKKCKGVRTVKQKKILELYIPRGSREGDKIVLAGEADQDPDDEEPGDIIFELVEEPHKTFNRAGADLQADLDISLSEALTGFNRIVVTHLDGRGIQLNVQQPRGKVLRPDEVIKVSGEGMPVKKSDNKGDLYLTVNISFPEDGWLESQEAVDRVRQVLPKPKAPEYSTGEPPELVDEVPFEVVENLDGFGAGSGDPRAGAEWEDEDGGEQAQCQTQ